MIRAAFVVALLALRAPLLLARERFVRVYDERDGLAVSEIADLAQDARGFIWIGTIGGLVRFDGRELRPWAPDRVRHVVEVLSAAPSGGVLVGARTEPLYLVSGRGVEAVSGPDGGPIDDWVHAALGSDGALWFVRESGFYGRLPSGGWVSLDVALFNGSPLTRVMPGPSGCVYVASEEALWRVAPAEEFGPIGPPGQPGVGPTAQLVAAVGRVRHLGFTPDSALVVLTRDGLLLRIRRTASRLPDRREDLPPAAVTAGIDTLLAGRVHGRGLAIRGEVIWASVDQYIYALRSGHPPEIVAPAPGLPTGRPLLVDREGTLWLGGYRGVLSMPEPETMTWNDLDGLPSPTHGRFVTEWGGGVWVSTWYGSGRIERDDPRRGATIDSPRHSGRFCADRAGNLWTARGDTALTCRTADGERAWPFPGLHGIYASAPRPDGSLWLATDDGILVTGPGEPRAIRCVAPGRDGIRGGSDGHGENWPLGWRHSWLTAILEDREGVLWIGGFEMIAHAPACALEGETPREWRGERGQDESRSRVALSRWPDVACAAAPSPWSVDSLPGANHVNAILQMPSGAIWIATGNAGVRCRTGRGWEEIPGSRRLASPRIYGMVSSPSGGVWILAVGSIVRVLERPDLPDGWEIVEQLTSWQGLPTQQASDLYEELGGRIWLASLAGVVEVPPEARCADQRPPPLELIELAVDGAPLPLDHCPALPYRRNRLEIRFAALSFRDRSLIRYRARTEAEGPWFESREPSFHFVDLAPGRHMAEIEASLDGVAWSELPARVDFVVRRPWYLQAWALAAFALAGAAALVSIHRMRLAFLLRLERQRTRIAMDLHDEMGSGLGSIGILAGLAADEDLAEESRRSLAEWIAETASELGTALTDIVWSLRDGAETLEALALRLAERGGRLVPERRGEAGGEPAGEANGGSFTAPDRRREFITDFPSVWPSLRLPLEVRRNLHLIAVEALHNAARHASARQIVLGVRADGRRWRLWVADDGVGIASSVGESPAGRGARDVTRAPARRGYGLDNMRRRAGEIGVDFSLRSVPGGGTTVEVVFDPHARITRNGQRPTGALRRRRERGRATDRPRTIHTAGGLAP